MIRILFFAVQLIILISYFPFVGRVVDEGLITVCVSLAILNFIVFFLGSERLEFMKKRVFKHSLIFLIGFMILHFQFPLDFILGNLTSYYNKIFLFDEVINSSIVLSLIGLLSFFVGYEIAKRKGYNFKANDSVESRNFSKLDLGAVLSLLFYFVTVNPAYILGNYGSVPMGESAGYASIAFKLFVFASLIQQTINLQSKVNSKISFFKFLKSLSLPIIIVVSLYLLSVLISGDRGPLIYFSLYVLGCYLFVTKARVNLLYIAGGVVTGAFLITLLSVVRSKANDGADFFAKVEYALAREGYRDYSVSPQTAELAYSINTLHTSVKFVPERDDFFYGEFQFKMLISTIPLLPTIVDELINSREYSDYGTSSEYFTRQIHGDHPDYGMGSSILADLYLDFGIVGIIMGMFAFGYFLRYSELMMYGDYKPSPFVIILILVYFSQALYINRSMILFELSTVVKVLILFKINYLFNKAKTTT